ncbi:hypothetical protein [Paenibacillus sp. 481]|uniref:hypothetical protein n=1 Tax=Paenibacillus sp. 481 TaxID=2835869 RepID=UPI001E5299F3|nr:hypothetical protein [Paenibacillus sp. 481]UHA74867.1 hypothetical protein KIK04_07410 [Paenibacillus sp. 481]
MELTLLHGIYVLFIGLIIGCLIMRKDTTIVCIIGIFGLGVAATGSFNIAISGLFTSFLYAITQLLSTILIISLVVSMSRVLLASGINEKMVAPVTRLMRGPSMSYWIIGIFMMIISTFFWPSPAIALVGAVLLPVAMRVGLPPLAIAMAMNLFGHGIALSGDFVIQAAPKLTADAAGLPVNSVLQASIPLVIVMGVTTTITAWLLIRRDIRAGRLTLNSGLAKTEVHQDFKVMRDPLNPTLRTVFALVIPLLFLLDVLMLIHFKLQGSEATALIGGTALLILLMVTLCTHRKHALEQTTAYLIDGLSFGVKVFGPVIPVAAFFYLGDAALVHIFGEVLPQGSHGIVNDLGIALAHTVPVHGAAAAVTVTAVGVITGLDGSGFSGISLAGSIAALFGTAIGTGADTLTALGQVAAIWVGGGTLIPWALIPAAAICGVSPFELARRNALPVAIGLAATTLAAMLLL